MKKSELKSIIKEVITEAKGKEITDRMWKKFEESVKNMLESELDEFWGDIEDEIDLEDADETYGVFRGIIKDEGLKFTRRSLMPRMKKAMDPRLRNLKK